MADAGEAGIGGAKATGRSLAISTLPQVLQNRGRAKRPALGPGHRTLAQAGGLPLERQQGLAVHRTLQPPRVNDPPHRNADGAADDHVDAAVIPEGDHDRAGDEAAHADCEVSQAEPPPNNPDENDRDWPERSHDPTIGNVGRPWDALSGDIPEYWRTRDGSYLAKTSHTTTPRPIHGIATKNHITVASALVRGLYFGHFTFGGSRVQGPERSRRALVVTRCEADSAPTLCSGSRFQATPGP